MLCCLDRFSWKDQTSADSDGLVSNFPGQRRQFAKTGGNALVAVPQNPEATENEAPTEGQVVSVRVPAGMRAGQVVQVQSPDGSSQTMNATIPAGLGPGQTFLVRFPPQAVGGGIAQQLSPSSHTTGPPTPLHAPTAVATVVSNSPVMATATATSTSAIPPPSHRPPALSPPGLSPTSRPGLSPPSSQFPAFSQALGPNPASPPFSQALDEPSSQQLPEAVPVNHNAPLTIPVPPPNHNRPPTNHKPQSLLLVNVPPGTAPGSTIHVQVPGESRTIAAKVPPGVSQFHVAYERLVSPASAATPPSASGQQNLVTTSNSSTTDRKLILVKVPPGTAPGTTLHVEVPEEPGRILAAQVPPGVSEFHVAYQPRKNNNDQSNYNEGNNRTQDNNYHGGGEGSMGNMILPAVGGAALAVAGAAMYEHFAHNDGGNSDHYSAGDDYGGGGDFDF